MTTTTITIQPTFLDVVLFPKSIEHALKVQAWCERLDSLGRPDIGTPLGRANAAFVAAKRERSKVQPRHTRKLAVVNAAWEATRADLILACEHTGGVLYPQAKR